MMLRRPGPSPAAPSGEASRPPALSREASGVGEATSSTASTPVGWDSRTAVATSACRSTSSPKPGSRKVAPVLGQRGSDHVGARRRGELDEEAADPAGGADHEYGCA